MFEILIEGLQIAVFLGQGHLLQSFLGSFMQSRFPERRKSVTVVLFYGGMRYLIYWIFPVEGTIGILGRIFWGFLLAFLVAIGFYRAQNCWRFFLTVTYQAVSECSFFFAYMVLQAGGVLTGFLAELFGKGYFASEDSFLAAVEWTMAALMILTYGIFLAIVCLLLKRIVKSFREKEYCFRGGELMFLVAPGMVGILLCVLLRVIMITVENDKPRMLYDRHPPLLWLVPAILVLTLLSIQCAIKLFQDMIDLNREKSSRIVLEKQIECMQAQVREMEHIYAGVRGMKHDMRNTLSVVMGLAGKGGENSKLQEYLKNLNQSLEGLELRYRTGNEVVDILLNIKYPEIRKRVPDISFDVEQLMFSPDLTIQSYDLGVIVGNALDNAVEACIRLKTLNASAECFIRLRSFQRGKMFFFEVENSFGERGLKKAQREFPGTNKADKEKHGMGMQNIKKTAEKYQGAVDWTAEDGVFLLSVMMKNERRSEDDNQ